MQIAHRAYIRIARVAPPHPRRIGHHGLQLLPHHRLRIGEQDGVAIAFRHLAPIRPRQLGRGSQQHLRLGQNRGSPGPG